MKKGHPPAMENKNINMSMKKKGKMRRCKLSRLTAVAGVLGGLSALFFCVCVQFDSFIGGLLSEGDDALGERDKASMPYGS